MVSWPLSPRVRFRRSLAAVFAILTAFLQQPAPKADGAAQSLPLAQDWTNVDLITTNDNWAGVPGIVGYRGDDLTTATGTNPQTIVADGTLTSVNVLANQPNPNTLPTGGVAEFDTLPDSTVALQGSGTADAPFVLLNVNTIGLSSVIVAYNLRDVDGSLDNAVQPVALQYRVGSTGNFTNLPAGFVADATTGPGLATQVTPVSVTLPPPADNQPLVQVRVITANAVGNDEWVGIDDLFVTGTPGGGSTDPAGVGAASPNLVTASLQTLLTVVVTPGTNPPSSALHATLDLSAIGGADSQALFDDGSNGDALAGDNTFSFLASVSVSTSDGAKTLTGTVVDHLGRSGGIGIDLHVKGAHGLPFSQDWTDIGQITANNDWRGVPSVVGHRGDGLTALPGADPQTIVGDGSATPLSVLADLADASSVTGALGEFHLADPTVGFQGSGTADAPHLVLNVSTLSVSFVGVSYNLRDLDDTGDNSIQPVALQYRVGASGNFINVPDAFVPDATEGPNLSGLVTPVTAILPAEAGHQPLVQIRVITADAVGSDEWVGVDDISISVAGTTGPTGTGNASPSNAGIGETTLLTVQVTPGTDPPSTALAVSANLMLIGGPASQPLFDDGTHGDDVAGNNVFSFLATIGPATSAGPLLLSAAISDEEGRGSNADIALTVDAPTSPSATGSANPPAVVSGGTTTLTVTVIPGEKPASTSVGVTADLSSIGGSSTQSFSTSGGNVFTYDATVDPLAVAGAKSLPVTVTDGEGRSGFAAIALTVFDPLPEAVQTIPFAQNWSNTGMITANDVWTGVGGIVGYLGEYTASNPTGVDPQTVLFDMPSTPVDVIANQANPNSLSNGGVAEFDGIPNSTVALNGSGGADAPFLLISLSTVGHTGGLKVAYNLRDLDGSVDNSVQAVALQYRVGGTGPFTNVPAGFVADATAGPSLAGQVTPVSAVLPDEVDNLALVQLRIITTNAAGNDEWVGIDDIFVTDVTDPTGVGSASPSALEAGQSTLLTVAVTPGNNPPSTMLAVTMDLAAIGGSSTQSLFDDGTHGDVTAGNQVFSFQVTVAPATTSGSKVLPGTVSDAQFRSAATSISLNVLAPTSFYTIAQIQGSGTSSTLAGVTLRTEGIVTGRKINGFFIQSAVDDGNPATSDGIFVFTSSAPSAASTVGNLVAVRGLVQEFVPNADPVQPPVTELGSAVVTLLSTGHPLPAPIVLTAADTNPSGSMEQLERVEGMRVQVDSLTVAAPTLGNVNEPNASATSNGVFYGVITGVARPLREAGIEVPNPLPPGAPAGVLRFDGNPERLQVDSDGIGAPQLNVAAGDVVTGLVGPLDYSFRTYMILPDPALPPNVVPHASPMPVSVQTVNQFTVGSANLERFFDTVNDPDTDDPVLTAAAFAIRLNKASLLVRNIMRSPDIIGAIEVENLSALQELAGKVNSDTVAAGQPSPDYVAYLAEGNDIGGIDVGFLVKSTRVAVIDITQVGKDATYINPNNGQPELLNDRPSLVLRAIPQSISGATLPITVIVNHLRSLSGVEDPADGNRVRTKRRAQAEFLADLVQGRQLADPTERIVLVGDFNAFQFSDGLVDTIGTIKGTPAPESEVVLASNDLVNPDLTNLVETIDPSQRYSFSFDGNAQTLDHALVTSNLLAFVDVLQFGRVDADFPEIARNDGTSPVRLSDHDPLVVFFNFARETSTLVTSSLNPSAFGQPVTFTATVTAGSSPATVGSVVFKEGAAVLAGPVPVNDAGQAAFSTSALGVGNHTITAEYSGTGNFAPSTTSLTQVVNGGLSISDVTVPEPLLLGVATFAITLSPASTSNVTVRVATANGTATAGQDYVARPSTLLTFPAGTTTQTIRVPVIGDFISEGTEQFVVTLSDPLNAAIVDGQGVGTIVDDDPPPTVFISDVSLVEGNTGTRTATFLVVLSRPSSKPVSMHFATADGTATVEADYSGRSGTLEFPAGTLLKTIDVQVKGDLISEANETFFVNLSAPSGAAIADGQGRGTVVNDDKAVHDDSRHP